ncbi:hypothetical protein J4427_00290 [Candidatus Woesearchaeota archaeon]|nr:hypothetical protein [Candidatus Woesearchaeota archaeon]
MVINDLIAKAEMRLRNSQISRWGSLTPKKRFFDMAYELEDAQREQVDRFVRLYSYDSKSAEYVKAERALTKAGFQVCWIPDEYAHQPILRVCIEGIGYCELNGLNPIIRFAKYQKSKISH